MVAANCQRRRMDGSASHKAGANSTGQVFAPIPRPSRRPAAAAARPEICGPARSTTANAASENSRHAGSTWPWMAHTRMDSGLHAY